MEMDTEITPSTISSGHEGDFCHQGWGTEIAQKIGLSKPTDMTIHWKALEKHFLMVPLVFRFNHFWKNNHFSEFF
jgi:hypothetical protein